MSSSLVNITREPRFVLRRMLGLGLLLALGCSTDTTDDDVAKSRIYATVSASAELVVLDGESHKQLTAVPIGKGPAILLGTPDEKQLFSANWGSDSSVSAIDVATLAVTNIPLGNRPYVIALSPDGQYLYAGIYVANQIAVINTQTHKLERSMPMDSLPASIIVSPDGKTLYVAMLDDSGPLGIGIGAGKLLAVDAATGTITKPAIEVGGSPAWITISPDGSKVYTLNATSDDISVVDTASWKVLTAVGTGASSQSIIGAVTPDGSRLYVTNFGTAELIWIDTKTNQVGARIPLTGKPVGVSLNAAGTQVYTTDFGTDSLSESLLVGLQYLTSGVYNGTGAGQVRAFDVATGNEVGKPALTGPGATSVVAFEGVKSTLK